MTFVLHKSLQHILSCSVFLLKRKSELFQSREKRFDTESFDKISEAAADAGRLEVLRSASCLHSVPFGSRYFIRLLTYVHAASSTFIIFQQNSYISMLYLTLFSTQWRSAVLVKWNLNLFFQNILPYFLLVNARSSMFRIWNNFNFFFFMKYKIMSTRMFTKFFYKHFSLWVFSKKKRKNIFDFFWTNLYKTGIRKISVKKTVWYLSTSEIFWNLKRTSKHSSKSRLIPRRPLYQIR